MATSIAAIRFLIVKVLLALVLNVGTQVNYTAMFLLERKL